MTTQEGEDGAEAQAKNTTFSSLMRPMRERNEKVKIVFGDTVRHIEKWERKGMPRRLVCEGLVMAALAHIYGDIYGDHDPRDWLSFFRHVISEAQKHETDVREGLMKDPPPQ